MARHYGDTHDLIDNVELLAANTYTRLAMDECRYCKAARTRTMDALLAVADEMAPLNLTAPDYHDEPAFHAYIRAEIKIGDAARRFLMAGCKRHKNDLAANFYCSPASETYWAS